MNTYQPTKAEVQAFALTLPC